jgi:hypothetical protein
MRRIANPTIHVPSGVSEDAMFVGLSISSPDVTSIRASRRISVSAKRTEKARPARPTHPHAGEISRPLGNSRSSSRNNPLGTTSETDQ